MPGDEGSIAEADLAMNVYKKHVIAYQPGGGTQIKWHMAIKVWAFLLLQERTICQCG